MMYSSETGKMGKKMGKEGGYKKYWTYSISLIVDLS
jgi:hypothetical protein